MWVSNVLAISVMFFFLTLIYIYLTSCFFSNYKVIVASCNVMLARIKPFTTFLTCFFILICISEKAVNIRSIFDDRQSNFAAVFGDVS